jgi:hypothetical protein
MVKRIEITIVVFDDYYDEDDIRKIIDEAFNGEQIGYWMIKETQTREVTEEEAEEITGY